MRAPLAILALVASACAASPDRGWTSNYTIHASPGLEDHATEMAELARRWSPLVAERLGTRREAPLTLWLRKSLHRNAHGITTDTFIAIDPGEHRHSTLVHELAHWHMRGTDWERLPQVVEEGLCDMIAQEGLGIIFGRAAAFVQVLPEAYERRRELLRMSNRTYLSLPPDEQLVASALGWYIASHHGVEGLRELLQGSPDRASLLAALEATPLSVEAADVRSRSASLAAIFPGAPAPSQWVVTLVWSDGEGRPIYLQADTIQGTEGPVRLQGGDDVPTFQVPAGGAKVSVHAVRADASRPPR